MKTAATILSIDDNPTNQKLMAKTFAPRFRVECAMSGQEGIDRLPSVRPNLILLDVDMPGLNGLDTCRKIRALPAFNSIPIIMVSCLSDPEDQIAGYHAGADDYLHKPVDINVLLAKVEMAISHSRTHLQDALSQQQLDRARKAAMEAMVKIIKSRSQDDVVRFFRRALNVLGLPWLLRLDAYPSVLSGNIERPSAIEEVLLSAPEQNGYEGNHSRLLITCPHLRLLLRDVSQVTPPLRQELQHLAQQLSDAASERISQLQEAKTHYKTAT